MQRVLHPDAEGASQTAQRCSSQHLDHHERVKGKRGMLLQTVTIRLSSVDTNPAASTAGDVLKLLPFAALRFMRVSFTTPSADATQSIGSVRGSTSSSKCDALSEDSIGRIISSAFAYYGVGESARAGTQRGSGKRCWGLCFDALPPAGAEDGSSSGNGEYVLLGAFDFPYKLSANSYRAQLMLLQQESRAQASPAIANSASRAMDPATPASRPRMDRHQQVVRHLFDSTDRASMLQSLRQRKAFCTEHKINDGMGQMSFRKFKLLRRFKMQRHVCFFSGLKTYSRSDLLQLKSNFESYGWELRNIFPVTLQSRHAHMNSDLLLIDQSVEANGSDGSAGGAGASSAPFAAGAGASASSAASAAAVGVMNIIMSARIHRYRGLIAVLCESVAAYEELRKRASFGHVPDLRPDLILVQPLLPEGMSAICAAHDALVIRRATPSL